MTWYGMIAHKPDGIDTCRGCVMDQWSGDMVTCFTEDLDEIKREYGPLALYEYDAREPRYSFTFLIDGRPFEHDWTPDSENPGELEVRAALYDAADRQLEINRQRAIEEKQREAERERQRQIREAERKELQERAEFARLQVKFGGK